MAFPSRDTAGFTIAVEATVARSLVAHAVIGPAHVALDGPEAVIDHVLRRCEPWLTEIERSDSPPTATIYAGHAAAPRGAWRQIVQKSLPFEPPAQFLVDDAEHRIVVDQTDPTWLPHHTLRAVQSTLKYAAFGSHTLFLHGACVQIGDEAILISGRSRSGKTSTMITALTATGGAYISNDDVTIVQDGDGLVVTGWPRSICLRRDTIVGLAESGIAIDEDVLTLDHLSHPTNRWKSNWGELDSVWLSPHELCATVGTRLLVHSQPTAAVFPTFDDTCRTESVLEPLTSTEALASVVANREPAASQFESFIAEWYPKAPDQDGITSAVSSLPCYRLRQTLESLASSRKLLEQLAEPTTASR